MSHKFSCWSVISEARVHFQFSLGEIYREKVIILTYVYFFRVLGFPPLSIILLMLRANSFINQRRKIILSTK
jgi:hypothetical protein